MSPRTLKLRARRLWRRRTMQVEDLSQQAGEQFERNFLARLGRLRQVWRFVLGWLLLLVILGGCLVAQLSALKAYYQVLQPVPGGIYSEGIEGTFTTANPLYAVSDVDTSVSRLLFAGLLTYNTQNQLVGDLASSWQANSAGTEYTVHLRPHLTWHDGKPLTADDVVFTYQTIQNPDAGSPLIGSWQGVRVAAADHSTVVFTLPNPLSSFPYSLTTGIIPKHLLGPISPVDLRSASFNTVSPVGAGPYMWSTIGANSSGNSNDIEEQISLLPFPHFWAGAPHLTSFNIHAFTKKESLIAAYQDKAINAIVGLDAVPDSITKDTTSKIYNIPLTAGVYVFFKTTSPILQDTKVRQALVAAADQHALLAKLPFSALPVDGPLLKGQLGYDPVYAQKTGDAARARALLDGDGWALQTNGIRAKAGQPLSFTLTAADTPENAPLVRALCDQWRAVGVDAQPALRSAADFQGALSQHSYDAVLYSVSLGVDPDVFVYWDSTQADLRSTNRLNFSEYKSTAADLALEAGRTRLDPALRIAKYRVFLQAWQQDAPALGLYQPRLLYIAHSPVYGLTETGINTDAERFNNAQDWMIHLGWVTR